jgi:hypothetical protein
VTVRAARISVDSPGTAARPKRKFNLMLALFVLSILPPSYFFLGELRLSFTRIYLLITFVPLGIGLLTGRAGRLRGIDYLMMAFMAWVGVTLFYHHGVERLPYTMITIVELFGGYLVGRMCVRGIDDVLALLRYGLYAMIFLFPFTLIELYTDRNYLQELSRKVMPTLFKGDSSRGRMGLFRVMSGFEHPILYGLFCSIFLAPLAFLYRQTHLLLGVIMAGFVAFMTFASLSSAPLIAVVVQTFLMVWGYMTKGSWWLLLILSVIAYVVVDSLSNRTPLTILINYITFNPGTAWGRIAIWDAGSAAMWGSPIMGIGLNDWPKPAWISNSVDNFWLLNGMRHGVLGVGLLIAALLVGLRLILRQTLHSTQVRVFRESYAISLVALCFTLSTVHVWGDTSSFVMMMFGSAVWIADVQPEEEKTLVPAQPQRRSAYSRFDWQPGRRA